MGKHGNNVAITSAAIFIILELAAFAMVRSSSTLQNIWMNRFSHRVLAATWSGTESVRGYFGLKSQNDALAAENFALNEKLREYSKLFSEEDLAAVKARKRDEFTYVPATIVKISRNSQHNYIIINKGSEDGLRPESGIISQNGIVGILDAVDKHYSYGLTLMNSKISVSARVGRNGVVSPLVWDGNSKNGAILKDVPMHSTVAPGDTVFTSGLSDIFPGGIPLGITGETIKVGGASSSVKVSLFMNFAALRYVTVCHNSERKEILSLEEKEEGSR